MGDSRGVTGENHTGCSGRNSPGVEDVEQERCGRSQNVLWGDVRVLDGMEGFSKDDKEDGPCVNGHEVAGLRRCCKYFVEHET